MLAQLASEPAREGSLLDLLGVKGEGLVADVKVGGWFGHRDLEMGESSIPGEVRRGL